MKRHLTLAAALFAAALSAARVPAQQPQPVFSVDRAAERIENLDTLKAELRQYHDCTCKCGCYARDLDTQADRALAFLRQRAGHRRGNEKLALVLDIDETTLSNYQALAAGGFGFDAQRFDAWVQSAKAPAIPGTLRLYKEAQRLGVVVFLITGRPETERAATERNLRLQGFDRWQSLTMRPPQHGQQTVIEYKSGARARIAAAGYTLALNVGDQWSDLKGSPSAEFNVKYPDPFYFIP